MNDNITFTHKASILQIDEDSFAIYCYSPFCTQFIDLCNAVIEGIHELKLEGLMQNYENNVDVMRISASIQDGELKNYQFTTLLNDREIISPIYTY